MGQFILNCDRTKMKAFIVSALLGLAAAAPTPDVGHHSTISVGGVVSHSGHFAPHVGPAVVSHAAPVVAHAVHAPVAHAVHAPVVAHPVAHAVHAAPVIARPVVHAAPVVAHAVHAPVVAHAAPAYHAPAPAYADEVSPYTYTYAVADGRIQHVKYSSNAYDGYVADVTYEGTAVY